MTASSPAWGRLPGYAVVAVCAIAVVVGCAREHVNSPPAALIEKPWANAGEVAPSRDGDTDAVTGLAAVLADKPPPQAPGRPLNILVMTGGGKYGAFTAGMLVGWTAAGDRPTFDVATGISSGGIVATLAFLGPKYDQKLAQYFTQLSRDDLYKIQPIRGLRVGTGIGTSEPLERVLAERVDEELLCDLRAAHAEGRRLYIGTGNVLSNRAVVWDMGAIASSGRPDSADLIRKILLASCSPPGVVHPVKIEVEVNGVRYTELHADAGNILQAFVRTPAGVPPGSNFWVLSAGKIYRDPAEGDPKLLKLVGGAVSNSLYALFRSDLVKLYALTAVTKSNFRLLSLPNDFRGEASAFTFNPAELCQLYWIGYKLTAGHTSWRTTPPDTLPGEATPPRIGTCFLVP